MMLTQELLKETFAYNKDTGDLFWINSRKNNAIKAGSKAGYINKIGYVEIRLFKNTLTAHRIIALMEGFNIPEGYEIDHINHNRADNRLENLRVVSVQDNQRNTKIRSTNTSGFNGVHYLKKQKVWRAVIYVDKKPIALGHFKNIDDAIEARKKANVEYGFHENHGKREVA